MSLLNKKVTVIGAGIGGLTAALALQARGADVTVLEQAGSISEVGAGLQISPNGFCVLRALGLGKAFQARAVQGQAVELRDYRKSTLVARLDLGLLPADQPYFFIHRADLIDALADAVRDAGVKVRLLQQAETIDPGPSPKVHLANGAVVNSDLVVGADGLHSKLRPVLNGKVAPFFTRQVAWRATIPNDLNHPAVARVHMAPKRHMVSYPLRGGELINLVMVQERMDWADEGWVHTDDPDNLRAAFSDFGGDAAKMLAQVTDVGLWGLFRHPVAPRWVGENVAILGDAAHPTLPFMAQGAVMAMEDAWVLADALDKAETTAEGLVAYQSRRHARASKVIDTASGNAWKYHLSFPPSRFGAHLGLKMLSTLAPKKLLQQFDWIYRHDVTRSDSDMS
ncbi:salicylate hydroxylase [Shimia gijangensis]|uniref:Salicylate hydroxylase n=1 Tax=Shimia gijangensis TaxID=1470563 RepID=A0A1M6N4K4_9RHOB|nr:FAD-dependent oxidoreductase [Shimia gijangensis]SHJ90582.1 salicylate hydroxylase [Shimia gijangensis]